MAIIRIHHLVKQSGGHRILDDVSLTIAQGQVAGIVGPSGSGKSTLLRCIVGLEPFDHGEVWVHGRWQIRGGVTAPRDTLLQLRRTVGMVFQQFHLFPHMTVLRNVMAGPLHVLGKSRAEAETIASHWLERVGLKDKLSAYPAQLSGGQQQRVAIARALAVQPQALLFDEPTSALDPRMAAEVMRVIDDLADDPALQVAMVIVSHDLSALRRIADVVHVLDRG
ncbi:MAG: amino acid ABC transporter ATP-binding protein, partial [Gemmataceae bacterium]|nr:amino acid ABC transporter ATP-binding protein [Gemmataceae bacterium]